MTSQPIVGPGYPTPERLRLARPSSEPALPHLLGTYRTKHGLSIRDAGGLVGASRCVWARWESGAVPTPLYLSRIAKLLGLTAREARQAAGPDRVRRPATLGDEESSQLSRWRAERSLTATEFGRRLHVSLSLVSRWEAGERTPGRQYWAEIAAVLGLSPDDVEAEFGPKPAPSDAASVSSLATLRRRRGLTQRQLAVALDLDVSTVQRWEKIRRAPHHQAFRLARVLHVRLIDLASLCLVPESSKPSASALRRARQKRHLPTRLVAARVGVSVGALRSWESNRTRPTWAHARQLSLALAVDVSEIFEAAGLTPPTHLDSDRWAVGDLSGILSDLRRWHGLTQRDVADRVGVCEGTVRSWEKGRQRPYLTTLRRLDQVFGLRKPLPSGWTARRPS